MELADNDCEMCLLKFNLKTEHIKRQKRRIVIDVYKKQGYPTDKIYSTLATDEGKELINSVTNKQLLEVHYQSYEEQRKKIGLFCATTSSTNPDMWDKYAARGTGVCIQYKFPTLLNKGFYTLTVNYDAEMLGENLYDKNGEQMDFPLHRWMFTKRIKYAFENEIRLVSNYNILGISEPIKEVFTGIFYGKETSQADIDDLEKIIHTVGYTFDKGIKVVY